MSGVMRYQRVSPDGLLLSNGKKPAREDLNPQELNNGCGHSRSGDIVLQWGHNKRSRGPRAESRPAGDDPSSSSSQPRPPPKLLRRAPSAAADKRPSAACFNGRAAANLRSCATADSAANSNHRCGEDRLGTRSPPKGSKMAAAANGVGYVAAPERDAGGAAPPPPPPPKERLNLDLFEWPRIYLSLSRKEKEDDFLAMKGAKLPQRPKKRAKNVDKALQYVFPGMWLSDLSRGRYEVREKKSAKKKRRGLKGMECLDSDSD
ncbi:uncharacterized protein LOC144703095 [Wolffia australiana]